MSIWLPVEDVGATLRKAEELGGDHRSAGHRAFACEVAVVGGSLAAFVPGDLPGAFPYLPGQSRHNKRLG